MNQDPSLLTLKSKSSNVPWSMETLAAIQYLYVLQCSSSSLTTTTQLYTAKLLLPTDLDTIWLPFSALLSWLQWGTQEYLLEFIVLIRLFMGSNLAC